MNNLRNKYQAVIFDMDGTLLDTIEDIADSMNAVLDRLGFPMHPLTSYRDFVGDGIEALAVRSLPEGHRTTYTIARSVEHMKEEYRARWSVKTRPFPGIPALLDGLAERGMALSILSNKIDSFTKAMAASLLSHWKFAEVRGLSPDTPRKPDPTGARICAERMGVEPQDCIFVGDSDIDMETAGRAGMTAFGALWGYQDRQRLIDHGARFLLDDPRDLLGYLPDVKSP
jgi:phosphoglycolate phosphatase